MRYDPRMAQPMREELTSLGFTELLTPEDVDEFMGKDSGTALVVVNSICGCAAGMARPGVKMALEDAPKPDRLATVFAGMELEATERARSYFTGYPPSSPSVGLFRDGELVHFIPRHQIEGRSPEQVADNLKQALEANCVPAS